MTNIAKDILLNPKDILYEDNHLLVVRKAPGILSQEDKSGAPDILTMAKAFIKERDHKPGNVYMGLVHRLDRNTGGVMCLAKTSKAASRLSEQIRQRQWDKFYLALSVGEGSLADSKAIPPNLNLRNLDLDTIDGAIDWIYLEDYLLKNQDKNKSRVLTSINPADNKKDAKKALLKTCCIGQDRATGLKLFLVDLGTGRSHQIRAQFSSRNLPLIGDTKYRTKSDYCKKREAELKLPPYFLGLWAWGLKLYHPVTKEALFFTALPQTYPWSIFFD